MGGSGFCMEDILMFCIGLCCSLCECVLLKMKLRCSGNVREVTSLHFCRRFCRKKLSLFLLLSYRLQMGGPLDPRTVRVSGTAETE